MMSLDDGTVVRWMDGSTKSPKLQRFDVVHDAPWLWCQDIDAMMCGA